MNRVALARHYDVLTPWERLPLLVAAEARGDEVEHDRLLRSAPKQGFQVPDYWGLVEALEGLAKLYLLRQLDSAVGFWRWLGSLEQDLLGDRDPQHEERLWKLIKLEAYQVVVRAEGWKRFCQELQVDADFLVGKLPGSATLAHTEGQARLLAFTAAEARVYLRELFERSNPPDVRRAYHLDTAADVAAAMRETLDEHVRLWT
jgi:hypothetical protein